MTEIEIEINGQTLKAQPNQTVIQVADAAGIYIPRFCYHPQLSIPANCRMCLVEVEKSAKPLPACATPVTPGMKISTQSQKALAAQRAVMEFLLINHPLDCPICDQGGECELQDLAMGYGSSHSNYDECKRSVVDEDLGPLIATDMTRCIQCTRCVRFGDEVAGFRELGVLNRGEDEAISTYVQRAMKSEVSGNIIDLCPVGALTSKPYRFKARPWELDQTKSVSPHDCLGSNLHVHTRYGKVMRVVSCENTKINETWISDRDRFSYAGLYHQDRLEHPIAKMDGEWQVIDWQYALEFATSSIKKILREQGADQIGALASPNSTLEEFYLLQKIMRGLGSPHIDHRLRAIDTQDDIHSNSDDSTVNMKVSEIQQCDAVWLIGCNIQKEVPIASLWLRKAFLKGATISALNAVDYAFNFKLKSKKIISPHEWVPQLIGLVNALDSNLLGNEFAEFQCDDEFKEMLKGWQTHKKICILLGAQSFHHPQAALIRYLAQQIAKLTGANLMMLTDGANSKGAYLAGAIPHRQAGGKLLNHIGLNAYSMLQKPRQAYILLNVEPELDCANAHLAVSALQQASFVMALSSYRNETLLQHANLILPLANFTETAGTFVNVSGEWQSFVGMAKAFASSRPGWKILRVLGNFLQLDGFQYKSSDAVKEELRRLLEEYKVEAVSPFKPDFSRITIKKNGLTRIGEIPVYAGDSLTRRSQPLQKTQSILEGELATLRVHPATASQLQLQEGDEVRVRQESSEIQLPVRLDARVAKDAAFIAGGVKATSGLGDLFGEVEIIGKSN